jgi:hypothetical protein
MTANSMKFIGARLGGCEMHGYERGAACLPAGLLEMPRLRFSQAAACLTADTTLGVWSVVAAQKTLRDELFD